MRLLTDLLRTKEPRAGCTKLPLEIANEFRPPPEPNEYDVTFGAKTNSAQPRNSRPLKLNQSACTNGPTVIQPQNNTTIDATNDRIDRDSRLRNSHKIFSWKN